MIATPSARPSNTVQSPESADSVSTIAPLPAPRDAILRAPGCRSGAISTLHVLTATGVDVELPLAGPGGRSYAFIIDWHIRVVVAAVSALLALLGYWILGAPPRASVVGSDRFLRTVPITATAEAKSQAAGGMGTGETLARKASC